MKTLITSLLILAALSDNAQKTNFTFYYDFFSRKPPSLGALAGGRIEK